MGGDAGEVGVWKLKMKNVKWKTLQMRGFFMRIFYFADVVLLK